MWVEASKKRQRNAVEKEDLLHWEEHSILVCAGDLEEPRNGVDVAL